MANGVIVPSKRLSSTEPRSAPPAVDMVPSSAAAVPATWGSGSIAAVLLLGMMTATAGSSTAMAMPNTSSGGRPSPTHGDDGHQTGRADEVDGRPAQHPGQAEAHHEPGVEERTGGEEQRPAHRR